MWPFFAGDVDHRLIDMMTLLSTHSLREDPLAPPLVPGGVNSFNTEHKGWP